MEDKDKRSQKVMDYTSIWSNYCGIKFIQTDKIDDAKIRIAFQAPSSWSYIGTDALGVPRNEPTVNFGWLNSGLSDEDYKQVVLHEFGHVLGLVHEHQSPSVKMQWNKPYVNWYFFTYYQWTSSDVETNLFQEFEKSSIRYSVLDDKSIMAYYISPQFTIDHREFPQNYVLSKMDEEFICKLYPKLLCS